ncbi:hypothetical protein BGX29_003176 [Mortierella sp. GBA35]|nr:hypothetical protein BGX29_003176 [Mortierella sp. GBA35]KAF9095798.1 hypothetical protein BGX23_012626 [Mortierella sp. AD031]
MDRRRQSTPTMHRYRRRPLLLLLAAATLLTTTTTTTLHLSGNLFAHGLSSPSSSSELDNGLNVQGPYSSLFDNAYLRDDQEQQSLLQDLEIQCRQILDVSSSPFPAVEPPEPILVGATAGPPENSTWRIWYRTRPDSSKPEEIKEGGFLLGNGRTQVMVGGGINLERLYLSEESSWSGGPGVDRVANPPPPPTAPQVDGDGDGGREEYWGGNVPVEEAPQRQEALEKIRLAMREKGYVYPKDATVKALRGDERGFGSQVPFGELLVEEVYKLESVQQYRRELDLETGVATVTFSVGDLQYKSYPDSVCVMRIQASEPKSINIKVSLKSAHEDTAEYTNVHNRLGVRAHIPSNNLTTEVLVSVTTEGANGISLANNRQVVALGFDAVTLYYTMGTGWTLGGYPKFEDKDPHDRLTSAMDKMISGFYGDQYLKHVKDHQALFQAFNLDLGQPENKLPTDELLKAVQDDSAGGEETYLEALMVQYGRYLLIASSRPGSLPLSGRSVWSQEQGAGKDDPRSGYKMDIDLQMNYWLAESTGLGETVTPLIDYMEKLLVPRGQDTASLFYGARGWLTHPYSNIWAHTGPTAQPNTFYLPTAAAWLCQHAWDRYLYSQDYYFLRDHAYKLMKTASQFWLDSLVRYQGKEDGPFVVSPSFAPGHGPVTEGTALDQQLVWQLLNNTLEAIAVVGERDRVFVQNLTTTLEELSPGFKIGSWGQLQEWSIDNDDPNERHPHLGHFWAVYPGSQIFFRNVSSSSDPEQEQGEEPSREELLAAAREALICRGMGDRPMGGNTGWAKSWRAAVWARLGDGQLAYKAVETFKRGHVFEHSNLLDFEDGLSGLLGVGAAIVEMVIQSRAPGYVDILTVQGLPERWLRRGRLTGFRTREGHTVSSMWMDGKVRKMEVLVGLKAGSLRVRVGGLGGEETTPSERVRVSLNGKVVAYSREEDVIVLTVANGQTYVIDIDN